MIPVLDISNLCVERNGIVILNRVNWRIERGRHWIILGPNGSGKTSLLSALTGYLSPTAGRISVMGNTCGQTDWRDLRKRIGLAGSSIGQWIPGHEPALETVASGKYAMIGAWQPAAAGDRRVALNRLRQMACAGLAGRPWRVLSQGERQRVLIARALMARPPILILDEPCAGLDPVAREGFLRSLQRLGEGASAHLVLVTHHVEEIMPVFSHVLMLKDGRVLAAGEIRKALTAENLSRAFGAIIALKTGGGRYAMKVLSPRLPCAIVPRKGVT
ncbi:MAG: ATP-binding cassette domain-containing protein [Verrucomicrobia bacterium]|nr:ATP-binding cassette domain-containing protein [Verrucomicrobiota bacterium]MDE3100048.1 ATP-binding cassette domain-containing protein [Verrucomicrobiota bacterium]